VIHRGPEPAVAIPALDVASFVLEGADRHGARPALVDGATGRTVSHAVLARRIRAAAAGLARRGFGRGDVLAVLMPNTLEYPVVFHGATLAGGACTTLNPLYTETELVHQLRDSGARLLVTAPGQLGVARAACAQVEAIEEVFVVGEALGATSFEGLLGDPAEARPPLLDPAVDLAALPYSSGTTGLSKGVMLTHRNLVADVCQTQAAVSIESTDVLVAVLPFFHIYGMNAVMNAGLRAGATLVTIERFDFQAFLELIERHAITKAYVVPPIALALAKEPGVEDHDLSSLKAVISGGAPLGADQAQRREERIGCPVKQAYGLTETSSVTHIVRLADAGRHETIGQPIPNTECRVVDPATGADLDLGEHGELWIRGPQVMAGYLGNPEATASTVDPDGWLRTGDVAVVDADGYFQIVDRLKELIKYKGYQVAPAELEALIVTHPEVRAVAVVGVPDEQAGELPKAFVVPAGESIDEDDLIAWVAERIAPQKRVRLVEAIDEIPRSASGKILRRLLRGG
jgi:acyl-CoA synthetase (AMP-forming)/AMP-acid ligase II